ncbi:MAG: hypothetical protein LBN95_00520 [Prevotellaceae bacterium]|jgi:hypothetical protein|nr:hypothetical protein [Prevotellaceae bacterium]
MKKISFITALIACASMAYAQEIEKPQLPKNEISISVGDNMFETQITQESDYGIGSYSLSYHNRVTDWFWYGVTFNSFTTVDTYDGYYDYNSGQYVNDNTPHYNLRFSLAPSVRFSYLNKPNVTLYSGIALGWGLVRESSHYDESNYRLGLYFQATAFGFSVGKKFFFGGEIGIGYKGLYSLNVGYRF